MLTLEGRREVLAGLGAGPVEVQELLAYNQSEFDPSRLDLPLSLPLPGEAHVAAWRVYEQRAAEVGAWQALREAFVQMHFPIGAGISRSEEYRAATLRGTPVEGLASATGLLVEQPCSIELQVHDAAAGPVPVLVVGHRPDFVALVRALAMRNEPLDVPASMGAATVKGFNNWDRIARLRRAWEVEHPGQPWGDRFAEIIGQKHLYQDRFIILSRGDYSHVGAEALGLGAEAWEAKSLRIRLEHECAHYFTWRLYGSMRNRLLDELICDYAGLVACEGRFRADWFLRFMGLERYPDYRPGGRFENYLGEPPLSPAAQCVARSLVHAAALNVEAFDASHPVDRDDLPGALARRLLLLTHFTLEGLAASSAVELLLTAN